MRSKKYKQSQADYASLQVKHSQLEGDLSNCNNDKTKLAKEKSDLEAEKANLNGRIADLNKQMEFLKDNNTTILRQLQDLSVISSSQAESIKKSLDNIGAKDAYIIDLQTAMARKDSLNMAIVMNLKGSIGNMNDEDINIKLDKKGPFFN